MTTCADCGGKGYTALEGQSSELCRTCLGAGYLPAGDQLRCLMTRTVMKALDNTGDHADLALFRNFMDNWLSRRPLGQSIIGFYQYMTPVLLDRLEKREDAEAFYCQLWSVYLSPCLEAIKSDNNHKALRIYLDAMKELLLKHAYDD